MRSSVWTRRALLGGGISTAASSLAFATLPPKKPPDYFFLIFFEHGSAELSAQARNTIVVAERESKEWAQLPVFVDGHSDAAESAAAGIALSQVRAEAVKAELVRAGVAPDRIHRVKGYSNSKPFRPKGEMADRRVEIRIGDI